MSSHGSPATPSGLWLRRTQVKPACWIRLATSSNRSGLRGTRTSSVRGSRDRSASNRRYALSRIASSPGPVLPQTHNAPEPSSGIPSARASASSPSTRSAVVAESHLSDEVTSTRSAGTPSFRNRAAVAWSWAPTQANRENIGRVSLPNQPSRRALRSVIRPFTTATGTPRAEAAATRLYQTSNSTRTISAGLMRPSTRDTIRLKSKGNRKTLARPYNCTARA